jgi:hypothetical protein
LSFSTSYVLTIVVIIYIFNVIDSLGNYIFINIYYSPIPSPGKMGPTVIDKGQLIEPIGSRLRDHTRTFDSGVRARTSSRRILPGLSRSEIMLGSGRVT